MTINYDKYADGLVPAIVQDANTNKVLMLAFVNAEALAITQNSGRATFFSRSRRKIWTKGETSGNFLEVREILTDCDGDTLLIKAIPKGAVCHTGADTCFDEKNEPANFLGELEQIIKDRRDNPSENSYTSQLFAKGINKIAQKVGEEAVELVIEAKDDDADLFANEAADLLFHLLILLRAKGFDWSDVVKILEARHRQ